MVNCEDMKKIIPVIMIAILAMASCHRTKVVAEGEKEVADESWGQVFDSVRREI